MDTEKLNDSMFLVIDNFLHPDIFPRLRPEIEIFRQWKPEPDHPSYAPIGLACNIARDTLTFNEITKELEKLFSRKWEIDRIYVNRFQPREEPRFHFDGNVLTCLLYVDEFDWHPDEHGETQLLVNGEIRGVLPFPNRMLVFDGRLAHRATSFQTQVRHTIATKLTGVSFADIILPGSHQG